MAGPCGEYIWRLSFERALSGFGVGNSRVNLSIYDLYYTKHYFFGGGVPSPR